MAKKYSNVNKRIISLLMAGVLITPAFAANEVPTTAEQNLLAAYVAESITLSDQGKSISVNFSELQTLVNAGYISLADISNMSSYVRVGDVAHLSVKMLKKEKEAADFKRVFYSDTSAVKFKQDINYLTSVNIFSSKKGTKFYPNFYASYADVCDIFYKTAAAIDSKKYSVASLARTGWYDTAFTRMQTLGMVPTSAKPGDMITKTQTYALMFRLLDSVSTLTKEDFENSTRYYMAVYSAQKNDKTAQSVLTLAYPYVMSNGVVKTADSIQIGTAQLPSSDYVIGVFRRDDNSFVKYISCSKPTVKQTILTVDGSKFKELGDGAQSFASVFSGSSGLPNSTSPLSVFSKLPLGKSIFEVVTADKYCISMKQLPLNYYSKVTEISTTENNATVIKKQLNGTTLTDTTFKDKLFKFDGTTLSSVSATALATGDIVFTSGDIYVAETPNEVSANVSYASIDGTTLTLAYSTTSSTTSGSSTTSTSTTSTSQLSLSNLGLRVNGTYLTLAYKDIPQLLLYLSNNSSVTLVRSGTSTGNVLALAFSNSLPSAVKHVVVARTGNSVVTYADGYRQTFSLASSPKTIGSTCAFEVGDIFYSNSNNSNYNYYTPTLQKYTASYFDSQNYNIDTTDGSLKTTPDTEFYTLDGKVSDYGFEQFFRTSGEHVIKVIKDKEGAVTTVTVVN